MDGYIRHFSTSSRHVGCAVLLNYRVQHAAYSMWVQFRLRCSQDSASLIVRHLRAMVHGVEGSLEAFTSNAECAWLFWAVKAQPHFSLSLESALIIRVNV